MPLKARLFVLATITSAVAIAIGGLATSRIVHLPAFVALLSLAAIAASTKVRLPGITGTYSLHFVVILLGIPGLSLIELIAIAEVGALIQSVWRVKQRLTPMQIAFNMAVLVVAAAVARSVYILATAGSAEQEISGAALAAAAYWVLNTGAVSVVLALVNEGTVSDIWATWSMWSLPYYLISAALTIPTGKYVYDGQWQPALLLGSAVTLVTVCFRIWVQRMGHSAAAPLPTHRKLHATLRAVDGRVEDVTA
jgi:hypothetical protein